MSILERIKQRREEFFGQAEERWSNIVHIEAEDTRITLTDINGRQESMMYVRYTIISELLGSPMTVRARTGEGYIIEPADGVAVDVVLDRKLSAIRVTRAYSY